MLFNSIHFLIFFIIVTLGYWSLGWSGRWRLLLFASCYFYMVFMPIYILILFFTIVIDYFAGIYIEQSKGSNRKLLLIVSLISNIGILAIFKYYNFFNTNLSYLLHLIEVRNPAPYLKILLPIGLSFHTFQAMSYTIEVYRGNQKAERHFGIYALYVMFYPQLVAGPIERPQNVIHQFYEKHQFNWEKTKSGLMMMAWGLFKKVVIADRLAMVVDSAYNNPSEKNGLSLLVATFFYTFQIYCDFSGYSEIALGSARVMGFELMENFKSPYFSKSISEFWRRWHISLSTWFRDYLYIPIGGNRVAEWRRYFNQFIVFMISGLWHGAQWTFVIWGSLHGFYLIIASARNKYFPKLILPDNTLGKTINLISTFVLVMLAWVFFRAKDTRDALLILKKISLFSVNDSLESPLNNIEILFSLGLIGLLLWKELKCFYINTESNARFYSLISLLMILVYFFGVFNTNNFIYFQF
ncbi:MBOAT family protein [Arcicella rosea]|uniref:D-alanyl-lipoteichoic acid acyltransferase DltB (MBOAT superfamily) n=1 Tax=Arcicella rosea TaxID=502909 RepID=A0A841ET27_9BACT|nr:MBOAT family O-acyltransferase [Arcicella rosea]MBB6004559.1 D-alanyl-lipoteichoic acid acyltransferase DltB (MBOAT superfamily) [Arcicella rosea]